MTTLSSARVEKLQEDTKALSDQEIKSLKNDLTDWQVIEVDGEKRLRSTFNFKNFRQALDFTDRVGRLAEDHDHHPTLVTEWGKVTVDWWTHKINGLHRNDFIMAAKTDQLYNE